ncbi:MAG: DUF2007 domain-containing protein [Candidatus Krumholzibacteria bacterium]|nr:DUF2007 domain-containing protein [Candidatus Krumholzibacteria bacterium]
MTEEKKNGNELVELMAVQGEMEAKILYGILESEGIRVLVKSEMASGVLPFTADGMGRVRLMVKEEDLTLARVVISEHLEKE